MRKIIYTLGIALGLSLNTNAQQIESLAGPRVGAVLVTPGLTADLINTKLDFDIDDFEVGSEGPAFISLYGWQWESRFADGGDVTGIVEWILLVGGMEKGLFLPSVSSMVGARTSSGLEFAVGPNVSLSGVGMVFGAGYNFKSGDLNLPVNIAFVPGMERKTERRISDAYIDGNGNWVDPTYEDYKYNTGTRISITVGFNLGR